jgi:hypothetical protein
MVEEIASSFVQFFKRNDKESKKQKPQINDKRDKNNSQRMNDFRLK